MTSSDTDEQKKIMQSDPRKYLTYRKNIESEISHRFKFILNGSAEQKAAREVYMSLNQHGHLPGSLN